MASSLLESIRDSLPGDAFWGPYLDASLAEPRPSNSIHLAIFNQPYIGFLLSGAKTIESRFSCVRCAPYRCVKSGDLVLVKRSGGPIVALFRAGQAHDIRLTPRAWKAIREQFGEAISAASEDFWRQNETASYATLIHVEQVRRLDPIPWNKSDRRGWVVLRSRHDPTPRLFE